MFAYLHVYMHICIYEYIYIYPLLTHILAYVYTEHKYAFFIYLLTYIAIQPYIIIITCILFQVINVFMLKDTSFSKQQSAFLQLVHKQFYYDVHYATITGERFVSPAEACVSNSSHPLGHEIWYNKVVPVLESRKLLRLLLIDEAKESTV